VTGEDTARTLARNPEGGVGVRVIPHPSVLELLTALEEPLLATSADRAGSPPPPGGCPPTPRPSSLTEIVHG